MCMHVSCILKFSPGLSLRSWGEHGLGGEGSKPHLWWGWSWWEPMCAAPPDMTQVLRNGSKNGHHGDKMPARYSMMMRCESPGSSKHLASSSRSSTWVKFSGRSGRPVRMKFKMCRNIPPSLW